MLGIFALGQAPLGGIPYTRPAKGYYRRYITAEELERRLKEQKDNTFGRRWFEEFEEALVAAEEKLKESKSPKQKKAIEEVLEAFAEAEPEVLESGLDALRASLGASRVTASIKHAERAAAMLRHKAIIDERLREQERIRLEMELEADDEEVFTLYLYG